MAEKVVRNIGERLPSDANDTKPPDPTIGLGEYNYSPRTQEQLLGTEEGGGDEVKTTNSVTQNSSDEIQLVNDEDEPGEWHIYGTGADPGLGSVPEKGWVDYSTALFHKTNNEIVDIDGNVIYEAISLFICRSGEAVERTFLVKKEEE